MLKLFHLAIDVSPLVPPGLGGRTDLEEILNFVTAGLASILGTMAVMSMLYGAYLYVVAAGNEDLMTRGKTFMRYPILGLVIAAFAYLIIKLIVKIMLG